MKKTQKIQKIAKHVCRILGLIKTRFGRRMGWELKSRRPIYPEAYGKGSPHTPLWAGSESSGNARKNIINIVFHQGWSAQNTGNFSGGFFVCSLFLKFFNGSLGFQLFQSG